MTRAARRIAIRTGNGSSAPPSAVAASACRTSSSFIWATIAREARVALRKPFEMSLQVLFDLTLGFRHESEARAVADARGRQADREGASVPERVEQAGPAAQFADALFRPRQVVGFLAGGLLEHRPQFGAACRESLRVVQRLGADLADVIHAHQRDRFPGFVVGQGLGLAHPDRRATAATPPESPPACATLDRRRRSIGRADYWEIQPCCGKLTRRKRLLWHSQRSLGMTELFSHHSRGNPASKTKRARRDTPCVRACWPLRSRSRSRPPSHSRA